MAREIFISYSRKDKAVVHPFVKKINQALGIECWIDLKGIESGAKFQRKLMEAIDNCEIVLFMLSDESLASEWTEREVMYAEDEGKRIVPVLVDGDKLRGWFKFHFGNVDFIDIRSEEQTQKLIHNLRDWLGVEESKELTEEEHQNKLKELESVELERIEINGKYGFAGKAGEVVIPCKWIDAWNFSEGLAGVKDNTGEWSFIDKTGKVVIPCKWKVTRSFSEGLAAIKDDNEKWGFIDKTGKVVIPCKWKDAGYFSEGLARVLDYNYRYGFIGKTGEVIIPCKWSQAWSFSDSLALVLDERLKYGFIDKTGKEVIPCKWNDARTFSEGMANVQDDNRKWWKIDKTGKVVREG